MSLQSDYRFQKKLQWLEHHHLQIHQPEKPDPLRYTEMLQQEFRHYLVFELTKYIQAEDEFGNQYFL